MSGNPHFGVPWARVIIVAYNSGPNLQKCVDCLVQQSASDFEVVIVDNNTPDDSVSSLDLSDSRFSVVNPGVNLGFAGGSNYGALGADTEWIITLNPDAFPEVDWLFELRAAVRRYPEASMLASVQLKAESPDIVDGVGDVYSIFGIAWRGGYGAVADSDTVPQSDMHVWGPCGAAAAYRRQHFEELGGFDEDFFCYLEDVDLATRMALMARSCILVHKAVVHHIGSASVGAESGFQFYQTYKNNLPMIVKTTPLLIMPVMTLAYLSAQLWILWRSRRHPAHLRRLDGLREAFTQLTLAMKKRKELMALRPGVGSMSFLRRLKYLPSAVRKHTPHYWAIKSIEDS